MGRRSCFFFFPATHFALARQRPLSPMCERGHALSESCETLVCKAKRREARPRGDARQQQQQQQQHKRLVFSPPASSSASPLRPPSSSSQLSLRATSSSDARSLCCTLRNGPAQRAWRGRRPPPGRPWLFEEGVLKRRWGGVKREDERNRSEQEKAEATKRAQSAEVFSKEKKREAED